jgi:peptidoglycan/LPS O-acetylase OafA/YrhL
MIIKNNFDFLRLLFAIFVIVSHSYPLSGSKHYDWLCEFTNGKLEFSYVGVKGFFIISGYLIFQSLSRSKNWVDFFWKRFLRLFPALLIVLLITILLAPIVYESKVNYLENKSIYSYVYKNFFLFRLQYGIPGVFETNIYGSAINGSLWTICYEFTMYILLSCLIFFKANKKKLKAIFFFFYFLFFVFFFFYRNNLVFNFYNLESSLLGELGLFFLGGSLLALLNFNRFKYIKIAIVISGLLILFSELLISDPFIFRILLWPVLIIGFGIQSSMYINSIGQKIGDMSYGIYIYGFPIQQTLMYYFKLEALELMFLSIPMSMLFGYLSWHLIESKMLKFKDETPMFYVNLIYNKVIGNNKSIKCSS